MGNKLCNGVEDGHKGYVIRATRIFSMIIFLLLLIGCREKPAMQQKRLKLSVPDTSTIPYTPLGEEIRYGKNLFEYTPQYLGPEGKVMQLAGNKMSCKNCHLDVGRRPYCNSLMETYVKYPQYRARDGMVLTVEDRINNCFERPLNGKKLPYDSREMRALVSYFRWLCEGRQVSYEEDSLHLGKLKLIERSASVEKGAGLYHQHCSSCHGENGQGQLSADKSFYIYPPLWGPNSYSQGSSMHRLIIAARFIKWSMPYEDSLTWPRLSDEEAFDLAAFINCDSIHPRPYRPLARDCPDIRFKPIDFPQGPYLDTFSERQHKYGPFGPIKLFYDNLQNKHTLSLGK